ncbi:DNA-binding response regulator [Pseudoalteromonas sp. S2893]|jgi:FixJ family two-component response regulator|nr:DNA-binding response regulator [Pseudoalteromonas sp. S2893]
MGEKYMNKPLVIVIDDEQAIREAIGSLVRSVGLDFCGYGSIHDFNATVDQTRPSCLILDVRVNLDNGLDFQNNLKQLGLQIPIIFITGYGDIAMSVKAMKAGAIDFLTKPFREQDLLDAIMQGLQKSQSHLKLLQLQQKYKQLSMREREVMSMAVSGLLNKQIASELNLSLITVKIHRANASKKMQASSFAELVRMNEMLLSSMNG